MTLTLVPNPPNIHISPRDAGYVVISVLVATLDGLLDRRSDQRVGSLTNSGAASTPSCLEGGELVVVNPCL
jgi:hypothetical protein